MASQSSNSSIATPGTLPNNDWGDYKTPQEYMNAIMANTSFSIEGGANGSTGETGDQGADADRFYGLVAIKSMAIPAGVQSLNVGIDLDGKIINITAPDGTGTTHIQNFGVGVIEHQTIHFVFNTDITLSPAVPTPSNYFLEVFELQEVPAP